MQSSGGITALEASRPRARTYCFVGSGRRLGRSRGDGGCVAAYRKFCRSTWEGPRPTSPPCRARFALAASRRLPGLPVSVPMLEIHTVGAGGGSLARFDAGGLLRVGPESAGADPGPICYGHGTQPTVTDANLLMGRLRPERFLGGGFTLDLERARRTTSQWLKQTGFAFNSGAIFRRRCASRKREYGEGLACRLHRTGIRSARFCAGCVRRRGRTSRLRTGRIAGDSGGHHSRTAWRSFGIRNFGERCGQGFFAHTALAGERSFAPRRTRERISKARNGCKEGIQHGTVAWRPSFRTEHGSAISRARL